MILASPTCSDETLVQHWLAVQAGLWRSSNINTLALCWAPDIPHNHYAFRRGCPTVKDTGIRRLNPDSFRPDGTPVTVKKGQMRHLALRNEHGRRRGDGRGREGSDQR